MATDTSVNMIYARLHGLDKDLILRFFWLYSSFEGALLDEGYFHPKSKELRINWKRFEKEYIESLNPKGDIKFTAARAALIKSPPKKRKVLISTKPMVGTRITRAGMKYVGWIDQTKKVDESDSIFALRMVRSVRNNLFHGGKRSGDVERNANLIGYALDYLEYCIKAHENIKNRIFPAA